MLKIYRSDGNRSVTYCTVIGECLEYWSYTSLAAGALLNLYVVVCHARIFMNM